MHLPTQLTGTRDPAWAGLRLRPRGPPLPSGCLPVFGSRVESRCPSGPLQYCVHSSPRRRVVLQLQAGRCLGSRPRSRCDAGQATQRQTVSVDWTPLCASAPLSVAPRDKVDLQGGASTR